MPKPVFVPSQVNRDVLISTTNEFLGDMDSDPLSQAARRLVDRGNPEATYVPAVKFILHSTLGIVTHPAVEPQISREINEREGFALQIANRITDSGLNRGIFTGFYEESPYFNDLYLEEGDIDTAVNSPGYLQSIGGAPFFDACMVGGGAFRFIKQAELDDSGDSAAQIIKRSRGLTVVSKVYKRYAEEFAGALGTPYAHAANFEAHEGAEGVEVNFIEPIRRAIHNLSVISRGCPAGKIALQGAAGPSVMEDYWGRIIDYLIPQDATADRP